MTANTDYLEYLNSEIDRTGTHSEKYELRQSLFGSEDVLPMWVADMDLPIAPHITQALVERMQHPILGYTLASDQTYQAIINWHAQKGLACTAQQIEFTHNVANGFHMAIQALSKPGDTVLVQTPVYPPFLTAPLLNNRHCVESPLELHNGRYQINFEQFEKDIIKHNVKLYLLCNPQNPSGRVWLKQELERLANICLKHNVLIISDEIHSSLINHGTFTSMASISKEIANITVTLDSPGKTFNLGGLQIGYAIIYNPDLLQQYQSVKRTVSIEGLNVFALVALEAAYSHKETEPWLASLNTHLKSNIAYLKQFLTTHYSKIKMMEPEASYLVWLDFRALFDNPVNLKTWLVNQAKLGLNDGAGFSKKPSVSEGFARMNIAVPKATLVTACNQLLKAKTSLP